MLQTNADLARIIDDARIRCWHSIQKGLDRTQRGHVVAHIHGRKRGDQDAGRTDPRFAYLQLSAEKAILPVKPVDDLVDQFTG